MYRVVALIGESGTGKDTMMKKVLQTFPLEFNEIVSCTTRPIREGEVDGINYHYMTDKRFLCKVNDGEMLEYTNFNNWFYGTSFDSLRSDSVNIGVFNPAGIKSLTENPHIDLTTFRVVCSDKTRLLRQLNRESDPNVNEIVRRYYADEADFAELNFDYIEIINEESEDLLDGVIQIMAHLHGE